MPCPSGELTVDTASSCGRGAEDTDSVQDSCPGRRCGCSEYHWSHGGAKGAYCRRRPLEWRNPAQGPASLRAPTSNGPLRSGTHGHQLSNPGQVMLEFPFLTSPRGPEATCPVLWRCWAHCEQQSHGASARSPILGQPTHGQFCRGPRCCAGPAS